MEYHKLIEICQEAADKLSCNKWHMDVELNVVTFPTTAGPRKGVVAGQAFTDFICIAFNFDDKRIKYCNGEWRDYDGTTSCLYHNW